MSRQYDRATHWISEHVADGVGPIENPLLVSVLKFGLPWNVFTIAFTIALWETISASFLYAWTLGLIWVNIAPALIWFYDERVLPEFFEHLSDLLPDANERIRLAEKYNTFFSTHRLTVSLFWAGATLSVAIASSGVLASQGMVGSASIFRYGTYLYAAYVGGVLGHGFVGPVTTVLLVREVTEYELEIDPLHPDDLGGLSTVGYISIRTTLLFSSGSFFLPLLFYFSSAGGNTPVILGITSFYIVCILASFVYPTAIVNRRAQEYRDSVLEELRQEYAEVESTMASPDLDEVGELNKRLELQRIHRDFDNYNSVNLYPLQIGVLARLAGSILLPLIFMVLELYLPNVI